MNPVGETMKVERKLWSKPFAVPQSRIWELFNRKEWLSHVFTTAGLRQLNLFSSTLGMDGLPGDQNDTNWISIGIGWGICWVQKHAKRGSIMHERCERNPKRHTKVKESEALSETDGLCSTGLHWITGYRLWWGDHLSVLGGPISLVQVSWAASEVQGNFLLLCSSTNFVG